MVTDVHRMRPRAFLPRHNLHPKVSPGQTRGPTEVKMILDQFEDMVITEQRPRDMENRNKPGIFTTKPHITWDNFFSGDSIQLYCAQKGFGMTNTVARNTLPKGVPDRHWHKSKVQKSGEPRPRATRWLEPIVASKPVGESVMTICSFQSVNSTNFTSVNAHNDCGLCAATKSCSKGHHKGEWGIEFCW